MSLSTDESVPDHPLAGQGLNLGLGDAEAISRILINGIQSGQDIGDITLLEEYESDRKNANIAMSGAMDAFKRLFGSGPGITANARNFGLGVLHGVTPVKVSHDTCICFVLC